MEIMVRPDGTFSREERGGRAAPDGLGRNVEISKSNTATAAAFSQMLVFTVFLSEPATASGTTDHPTRHSQPTGIALD
jgi:hypothetical protein